MFLSRIIFTLILMLSTRIAFSEPVVMTGEMMPTFLGSEIASLRFFRSDETPIPFQVDEVTADGEYVLPSGEKPNSDSATGLLKENDEIVFMWDDADTVLQKGSGADSAKIIIIERETEKRYVMVCTDRSRPLSEKSYIEYDHDSGVLRTPGFFARFAHDRFHFTAAGVRESGEDHYINLTNELRVEILFRALWGLIPIRYTEENIMCIVMRYKVGPLRLIRRGDFHLKLGMGLKGSRAAVNQICYSHMVKVPVYVSVPFRFGSFFSQAYIEMTPVINNQGEQFNFSVPARKIELPLSGDKKDFFKMTNPDRVLFKVSDKDNGYGWVLETSIDESVLEESGFILRIPSERDAMAECGYRLTVKNLSRGNYHIVNWVLFSSGSDASIDKAHRSVLSPTQIVVNGLYHSSRLNALKPVCSTPVDP